MLDCLRSRSCSEFQACTCNIIYKSPCFRDTRKGLPLSFSHGTYHCGWSKQLPDTKSIQQRVFLGLWNFPMKNRSTTEGYIGYGWAAKKATAQTESSLWCDSPCFYEYSFISCFSKWYIQFPFNKYVRKITELIVQVIGYAIKINWILSNKVPTTVM